MRANAEFQEIDHILDDSTSCKIQIVPTSEAVYISNALIKVTVTCRSKK